jgi:hypothetical protein
MHIDGHEAGEEPGGAHADAKAPGAGAVMMSARGKVCTRCSELSAFAFKTAGNCPDLTWAFLFLDIFLPSAPSVAQYAGVEQHHTSCLGMARALHMPDYACAGERGRGPWRASR